MSSTLDRVDWNAELVRGDLGTAVQQLKQKSGKGLVVAGVKLPLALAELADLDKTILEALVANSVLEVTRRHGTSRVPNPSLEPTR